MKPKITDKMRLDWLNEALRDNPIEPSGRLVHRGEGNEKTVRQVLDAHVRLSLETKKDRKPSVRSDRRYAKLMNLLADWWLLLNHSREASIPGAHIFYDHDKETQLYGQFAALDAIPGVKEFAEKKRKASEEKKRKARKSQ